MDEIVALARDMYMQNMTFGEAYEKAYNLHKKGVLSFEDTMELYYRIEQFFLMCDFEI